MLFPVVEMSGNTGNVNRWLCDNRRGAAKGYPQNHRRRQYVEQAGARHGFNSDPDIEPLAEDERRYRAHRHHQRLDHRADPFATGLARYFLFFVQL